MKTFLQHCAEDIYNKYADSLNELCIVFPNNRARLFFVEALYKQAGKAIWAPEFSNISDLFSQHCTLELSDPLLQNSLLFKVYQKQGLDKESFDDFYPWGSLLLKDFDNIDKNLADARQLFRNISELAAYSDDFEYLSPEQTEAIQRFFAHFETDRSELKKRFIRLWNQLFNIYTQFREELTTRNLAYEGMLQRWVVEHFDDKQGFEAKSYLFVGFNALSACEKYLFSRLQKAGKAHFYWDYDHYYLNNPGNEAGHFIRENLRQFPNELHESCFDNWKQTAKKIQFIDSSTEHAQVHYASHWMEQNASKANRPTESLSAVHDTAIVLCNETLLPGLLQCVPSQVEELNITMGYPVKQTAVYHLIRQVLLLHCNNQGKKNFRSRYVLPLLQNPYIRKTSSASAALEKELRSKNRLYPEYSELQQDELLTLLFSPIQKPYELGELLLSLFSFLSQAIDNADTEGNEVDPASEDSDNTNNRINQASNKNDENQNQAAGENNQIYLPLFQEALFKSYTQVQRLNALLRKDLLEINLETYKRLLLQILDLSVPFSGEPLKGLQIMGLLETRCLDFKNILMLSVNEGQVPKNRADNSFIPYNLRRAFNLSGPEHQDAISAYYFFRVLQRAGNITLVYNSASEGLNRGEMSRFMLQLAIESGMPVEILHLSSDIKAIESSPILIPKTPALMLQLYDMYDHAAPNPNSKKRYLSPSMLNTYLDCSLKYYFQYLLRLKKEEELSEQMDPLCFGTIFHSAAQYLYVDLILKKNGLQHSHEDVLASMENISAINRALEARFSKAGRLDGETEAARTLSGKTEAADLQAIYGNKAYLEGIVDYFMAKEFFRLENGHNLPALNGEQLI
ncbi:MAG: PD-(D/E)XK nuclease family protein [Bacteroidales bacterium]|nr:PD-(D/E)XK nuclease family protein [Bacteroidales bacterium]